MAEVGVTAAGVPNDGRVGYGSVLGLRIPADAESPLALAVLRLTASQLSDAIGGGLLEDALIGDMGRSGYPFHLDARRVAKGLLPNDRAAALRVVAGYVAVPAHASPDSAERLLSAWRQSFACICEP